MRTRIERGKVMPNNDTGIRIKRETKKRLEKFGHYKESHDAILQRLIKFYEEHQGCTVLVEGGRTA